MNIRTDDLRIRDIRELITPEELMREYPVHDAGRRHRRAARATRCTASCTAQDDRLAVVIGPCSIHDVGAALEYAARLRAAARAVQRRRSRSSCASTSRSRAPPSAGRASSTTPTSTAASTSTRACALARGLLLDINELGLPAGCEFLDMITPQYIADLVAWGAIGARTTESQVHRELASGLSLPRRLQERHRRQRADRGRRGAGRRASRIISWP